MNPLAVVSEQEEMGTRAPETEEEMLVCAARNGDTAAFETLVIRNKRLVMAITRRMTGSPEGAEDLTQQAFMKAWSHLSRFGGRCSFSTWLVSIAINEARMWNRKARRSREVSMNDISNAGGTLPALEFWDRRPSPERICSQAEWSRLLSSAMEHLPRGMREALKICDIEEQSTMTAAFLLGITVNAVKSRRLRGRLALRRKLESAVSLEKRRCPRSIHNQAAQPSRRQRASGAGAVPTSAPMPCQAAEESFQSRPEL